MEDFAWAEGSTAGNEGRVAGDLRRGTLPAPGPFLDFSGALAAQQPCQPVTNTACSKRRHSAGP